MAAIANQQNAIVRERPNGTQDGWREVSLGELTTIVRGRSYRSAQLQDNDDTALVTLKSFERGGGYRADGLKPYIGPFNRDQIISPGDMVVARTDITQNGDVVGRPAVVPNHPEYPNLVASLDASIVRVNDTQQLDSRFLYYRLLCWDYAHHVKSWATGTTVLHLSEEAIRSYKFHLPPLPEQRRIAHILGTLDDKIELNRRMNRTLEEMARALFKSWFVDFAPVRAKLDGRWRRGQSLPGLPTDLYNLFPDRLTPSELGEIPEGWAVKALDEIANFRNGLALQKFRPQDGECALPVVKIAQLRSGLPDSGEWAAEDITPECIIDDGDIIFSWSGSLIVRIWCGGRAALNQHLFKVTSSDYPKWMYLSLVESHILNFRAIAADKATTMGHIRRQHLSEAKCMVPSPEILTSVDGVFSELLARRISCNVESRSLAAQRDTLLPRLVSG